MPMAFPQYLLTMTRLNLLLPAGLKPQILALMRPADCQPGQIFLYTDQESRRREGQVPVRTDGRRMPVL